MVCRGHGVEGSELITTFRVNKCHLQGVFNPYVVSSQDEALSQMASQPASDSSCHLNAVVEILQLMSIGYSVKSSHMEGLTTFNANICKEVYNFVTIPTNVPDGNSSINE